MRCPKCKKTLIPGGEREYETLVEHVLSPNQTRRPLRPTHICPDQCFRKNQFFGFEGASYGLGHRVPKKWWFALDGLARKIEIDVALRLLRMNWETYSSQLKELIIEGEQDIPPRWTWRFYWLNGWLKKTIYIGRMGLSPENHL